MSIFEMIKTNLDLIETVKYYGIEVNCNGFASCLFHSEHTPSMKLYHDHFHCFGCGKSGDVVALIAQRLNISQFDSAKVLMKDFCLSSEEFRVNTKPQIQATYSEWERQTIRLLNEYLAYLHQFKTLYAPKTEHEPINHLFVESLHAMPLTQCYLDILTYEPMAIRKQFLQEYAKKLDEIEVKLDEYKRTHPRRKE